MAELHKRKNQGYSPGADPWSNFREAEGFGVPAWKGALIRLSDKYMRVKSLTQNPDNEQVGESIDDTLMDLSAYALIVLCLRREANRPKPDNVVELHGV